MNITNILILIFLMSAFAIGISLQDSSIPILEQGIDNASMVIQNITLEGSDNQYTEGMFTILENLVSFIGVTFLEIMRMGILFGSENPDYFETSFILKIVKLIIWLTIISLLIKPLFYLIIVIVMCSIWIVEKIKKKKLFKHFKEKLNSKEKNN